MKRLASEPRKPGGTQKRLGISSTIHPREVRTTVRPHVTRHGSVRGRAERLADTVDRRLVPRWTRRRSQPIDGLLVKLTEAADRSRLWLVLAAAGAAFGGRRGRRAAEYGVLALTFTSAAVNGPLKLLVRRHRPTPRRWLRRMPRTSSFPSGHAASAFAFAVAATRELPEAGGLLFPLATGVAYSRVYTGMHYPSDVIAGAMFGAAVGTATRPAAQAFGRDRAERSRAKEPRDLPEAVLVVSPHSGHSRKLGRARRALDHYGIHVAEELGIDHVDDLTQLLRTEAGEDRLVIAAGGDGTIGAVAGRLVDADNLLGILPLGTGNDFARSVGIPMNPRRAAKTMATGQVSDVDLGRLVRTGQPPKYFAHAATVGLNVDFAKVATRASVRARLGRLTYLAAAAYTLSQSPAFTCVLRHDGINEELALLQLSVISAPVIGGSMGLNLRGPYADHHRLDLLAVEDVPAWKILRAGLFLLLGIQRSAEGVRSTQVDGLIVDSDHPLGLAVDGELDGDLPGRFEAVAGAIHVLTPRGSDQITQTA